jgi:hypothetical protein
MLRRAFALCQTKVKNMFGSDLSRTHQFIRLVAVGDKVAKTVIFGTDKAFFVRNSIAISYKKNASRRKNDVFTPF